MANISQYRYNGRVKTEKYMYTKAVTGIHKQQVDLPTCA